MMKKNASKVTVRTIAEMCQVSRTAVSWALNGKPGVSPGTRRAVLAAARKLNYKVDPKVVQVMTSIARQSSGGNLTQIAIVSSAEVKGPPPWDTNVLLNRFYRGFASRIEASGFGLNAFWLAEKGMSNERMKKILQARGVEGIVFLFEYGSAQPDFQFDISEFSVASICRFIKQPKIDAADADIHDCICLAMEKAKEYGYVRPGLAVKTVTAERGNHSWESGFLYEQRLFAPENRIPIYWGESEAMPGLEDWFGRYQPDVVIGHEPPTMNTLIARGISIPKDVAFIALEQHDPASKLSCIDVHPEMIAAAAVDLVLERIKDGIKGEPTTPKTTLIEGHWVDGTTLPIVKQ